MILWHYLQSVTSLAQHHLVLSNASSVLQEKCFNLIDAIFILLIIKQLVVVIAIEPMGGRKGGNPYVHYLEFEHTRIICLIRIVLSEGMLSEPLQSIPGPRHASVLQYTNLYVKQLVKLVMEALMVVRIPLHGPGKGVGSQRHGKRRIYFTIHRRTCTSKNNWTILSLSSIKSVLIYFQQKRRRA